MYDRPTATELIQAVRQHLETQMVPLAKAANHKLYFQTLVAINVLTIVEREVAQRGDHLRAEWARLDALLGEQPIPSGEAALAEQLAQRNRALCAAVRAGQYDQDAAALFDHLKQTTIEQLQVANPRFLAALADEDPAR